MLLPQQTNSLPSKYPENPSPEFLRFMKELEDMKKEADEIAILCTKRTVQLEEMKNKKKN